MPSFNTFRACCTLWFVLFITWKYSFMSHRSRAIKALSCVLMSGRDWLYCFSSNLIFSLSASVRISARKLSSISNFSLKASNFLYLFCNSFRCFQSLKKDRGYLIVYRENHPEGTAEVETWLPEGVTVRCTPLMGHGKAMTAVTGKKGRLEISLPSINDYVVYKYEIKNKR